MSALIITLSAAIVVYASILILFGDSPRARIRARVNKLARNVEIDHIHTAVLSEKKKNRKKKKKENQIISRRFEDNLARSGLKISAREYVMLWGVLTLGPGIVCSFLKMNTIAIAGVCIIGFAIPPVMLQQAKNKRALLFNKQLGESLTIMSNCMRSGYSFQQAMGSIAREMQPPISTEFARVVREMNYGTSMEQALNNMKTRVNNKDLDLLISAVLTSAQVGANLSEILDTISETVSDRIRLREEVRVFSAQGRMSGIIIGLLPVAVILFLMILNPTYFTDFVKDPIGRMMLIGCGIMEITGFLLIQKIVDIKY